MTNFTSHTYGATSPQCWLCGQGANQMVRDHTVKTQVCMTCFPFLKVAHLVLGLIPGVKHPEGPIKR